MHLDFSVISGMSSLQHDLKRIATSMKDGSEAYAGIEDICSYKIQERKKYGDDSDLSTLWKILIPIVRVNVGLPSQELNYIPAVQPNCAAVDIGAYVVRPSAIAVISGGGMAKSKVRKHHMNLADDQDTSYGGRFDERRADAAKDFSPLECKVFLEKESVKK